jgi:hypothetical protein
MGDSMGVWNTNRLRQVELEMKKVWVRMEERESGKEYGGG